jgi:hypothetical protein
VSDEPVPANRAVVDHVVDDRTAVLLVGPDEDPARVDAAHLPDGAREGTWLIVEPAADPVEVLGIDEELTARRRAEVSRRMDRLRRERRGGRFGS